MCWLLQGFLLSPHLRPQAVHNLPHCVSMCVRPRYPAPPRIVPAVHHTLPHSMGRACAGRVPCLLRVACASWLMRDPHHHHQNNSVTMISIPGGQCVGSPLASIWVGCGRGALHCIGPRTTDPKNRGKNSDTAKKDARHAPGALLLPQQRIRERLVSGQLTTTGTSLPTGNRRISAWVQATAEYAQSGSTGHGLLTLCWSVQPLLRLHGPVAHPTPAPINRRRLGLGSSVNARLPPRSLHSLGLVVLFCPLPEFAPAAPPL